MDRASLFDNICFLPQLMCEMQMLWAFLLHSPSHGDDSADTIRRSITDKFQWLFGVKHFPISVAHAKVTAACTDFSWTCHSSLVVPGRNVALLHWWNCIYNHFNFLFPGKESFTVHNVSQILYSNLSVLNFCHEHFDCLTLALYFSRWVNTSSSLHRCSSLELAVIKMFTRKHVLFPVVFDHLRLYMTAGGKCRALVCVNCKLFSESLSNSNCW